LVHSIPIGEVKDMKSDVLRALKEKKLWTLFAGSILTIFNKKKLHRLCISFYNISTVGIKRKLKFVSNSVFPFITYPFLLIEFFNYKNLVFFFFKFFYEISTYFSKILSSRTSYKANTFLLKIVRWWNFSPR
jgi:hypothetical protein